MTQSPENEFDPRLLDLHLGALSEAEAAELKGRIASDAGLASQNEALAAMFDALHASRADRPQPSPDLSQRIAQHVAGLGAPPRVVRSTKSTAELAEELDNTGFVRLHSFREIVAVAAMIVLAVGLGVPGLLHMKDRSQRVACSANLANIGRGMQSYAMANASLPFVGWNDQVNSWRPTVEPGTDLLPNRRHVYPLASAHYVPTRFFVCPSTRDLPMPADQVALHDDFLEPRNMSYAYQNMAGARPTLEQHADLPVLGDDNPFFDNGNPLFNLTRSLGLSTPENTNSRVHAGLGQNILTLGGNVKWVTTPQAGIDGDNIWTLQDVDEYTGREGPQSPTDAHLLK